MINDIKLKFKYQIFIDNFRFLVDNNMTRISSFSVKNKKYKVSIFLDKLKAK